LEATGLLGTSREYFSRSAIHHNAVTWGMAGPDSSPAAPVVRQPDRYLGRVHEETFRAGAIGLKIHLYQLRLAQRLGLLAGVADLFPPGTDQPRLVRTQRRDVVAQAVSALIADTTRVYYQWVGTAAGVSVGYEHDRVAEPTYDRAEIARRVREIEEDERAWDDEIAACGIACERFWYEKLSDEYPTELRRAMRFVGLPDHVPVPPPQLVRQTGGVNKDFIGRYRRDLDLDRS
jgi:LPS sulfotransferase NodH